jgi:hypothetical protein
MKVRKAVISSALGLGMGAMLFTGMGTAAAAPGVSFDNGSGGTKTIGFGDRSAETGATANAASGNRALAVNVTSKTGTQAIAQGKGNNVVAIDGAAITGEGSEGNNVVVVGGIADVNGKHDNVVTLAGATVTDPSSHDNTIINGGGVALSSDQGEAAGVFSANVCGTQFAGQGSHVIVSKGAC